MFMIHEHGRVGDTRQYEWCRTVGPWCGTMHRQYAGGKTVDVWYGTGHRTVGVRHEPPPNYSSLTVTATVSMGTTSHTGY